jgi:hypothetical protein
MRLNELPAFLFAFVFDLYLFALCHRENDFIVRLKCNKNGHKYADTDNQNL